MVNKIGIPTWSVQTPQMQNAMIVGVDVYHKTVLNRNSVMGLVATMNDQYTEYHSKTLIQKKGQEMIKSLAIEIKVCAQKYLAANKSLPSNIVVYRDGVGEGQIS